MASALYISHRVRSCCHDNHIQALPRAPYTPTPRHHPCPSAPQPLDLHIIATAGRSRPTGPEHSASLGPLDRETERSRLISSPPHLPGETLYIEDRDGIATGNPRRRRPPPETSGRQLYAFVVLISREIVRQDVEVA
ncbi:unnamed protein product [Boreogadus saida]